MTRETRRSPPRLPPPSSLFALLHKEASPSSRSPVPPSPPVLHHPAQAPATTSHRTGPIQDRSSPWSSAPLVSQDSSLRPPQRRADQRLSPVHETHYRSSATASEFSANDIENSDHPSARSSGMPLPWTEGGWHAADRTHYGRDVPPALMTSYAPVPDRRLPYHPNVDNFSNNISSPTQSGTNPGIRSRSASSSEVSVPASQQMTMFTSPTIVRQGWPASSATHPAQHAASGPPPLQPSASTKNVRPSTGETSSVSGSYVMRKRLRISRACDECRRRKTKCDVVGAFPGEAAYPKSPIVSPGKSVEKEADESAAGSEDMVIIQPCTNCRRSMMECTYTKQRALKRNTSKSYYKDLERRLDSLETHIGAAPVSDRDVEVDSGGNAAESRIARLESALLGPGDASVQSSGRHRNAEGGTDRTSAALMLAGLASRVSPSRSNSTSPPSPDRGASLEPSNTMDTQSVSEPSPALGGLGPIHREGADITASRFLASTFAQSFPMFSGRQEKFDQESSIFLDAARMVTEPSEARPSGLNFASRRLSISAASTQEDWSLHDRSTRLARLVGLATIGTIDESAEVEIILEACTRDDRVRQKKRLAQVIEVDTLAACYWEALRHGDVQCYSILAALVAKLTPMLPTAADLDDTILIRRIAAFALERWHTIAFQGPANCQIDKDLTGDLMAKAHALGWQSSESLAVLRAACAFARLMSTASNAGGWKQTSEAQVTTIVTDLFGPERSSALSSAVDSNAASSTMHTEEQSPEAKETAMRMTLRSSVFLYYAIHTAPHSSRLHLRHILAVLRQIDAMLGTGSAYDVKSSSDSPLTRTSIAVHVLAIAVSAAAWAIRAIDFITSVESRPSDLWRFEANQGGETGGGEGDLTGDDNEGGSQFLARLRNRCEQHLSLCGTLGERNGIDPEEPGGSKGLSLRLAAFAHTEAQRSRQQDEAASQSASATSSLTAKDKIEVLARAADEFLDLVTIEMGPLGVILRSTTARHAWSLYRSKEERR